MSDFFNINSPKFWGGANVMNLAKIALAGFIVYKVVKK